MGRREAVKYSMPYIHEYTDHRGKVRRYFRRKGYPRVRLYGEPGSVKFSTAYDAAMGACRVEPEPIGIAQNPVGSVSRAIAEYYQSPAFLSLAPATRQNRRAILERFRGNNGDRQLATLSQLRVAQMLAQLRPWAARNWLKAIRGLMQFAGTTGLITGDPCAGIKPMRAKAGERHVWTEEEIAQYEARWPIGSRPRLAMALMLFTGAARADVIRLGRPNIRGADFRYQRKKTGAVVEIGYDPRLAEVIDATPSEHLTFLVTERGAPFTVAGFGNWFREVCDKAGLPQCSAHGLRHAQGRRLAENDCTEHQIAAALGHESLSEVRRYTRAANRAKLGREAIAKVSSIRREGGK